MSEIADFEPLRGLDDDVLTEVVREGELRLQAQLQIATAADQRALTFAGFQIATASATFAGGIALVVVSNPDYVLAALAWTFAFALLFAAKLVTDTVRPAHFHIPGNSPSGWLPSRWEDTARGDFSFRQARLEQAFCLSEAIDANHKAAGKSALLMHRAMDLTLWLVATGGLLLAAVIVARNFTIREPTSEIIRSKALP